MWHSTCRRVAVAAAIAVLVAGCGSGVAPDGGDAPDAASDSGVVPMNRPLRANCLALCEAQAKQCGAESMTGGSTAACQTACTCPAQAIPDCEGALNLYVGCAAAATLTCPGGMPATACMSEHDAYERCKDGRSDSCLTDGGSTTEPPDSGSTEVPDSGDMSEPDSGSVGAPDSGSPPSGPPCPTAPCQAPEVCCTNVSGGGASCSASCPPADQLGCITPTDCGGAAPDCCSTAVLAGGSFPSCSVGSVSSQCVAQCASNIALDCTSTETLHVCDNGYDCLDDMANPSCCAVGSYHICVPALYASAGGLSCR